MAAQCNGTTTVPAGQSKSILFLHSKRRGAVTKDREVFYTQTAPAIMYELFF